MTTTLSQTRFTHCPLCHSELAVGEDALASGASWRCTTCGQIWTTSRLATVAAYAEWVETRSLKIPA